jgi:release factor glutamine methyltransferase
MTQVNSDVTIGVCLAQSASTLNDTSDSARLDAEVLLAHVMDKTRTYFYTWPEKFIPALDYAQFQRLLKRRQNGEPIAYIVGEKEFWSHTFLVNPSTLIPRGDTELLVELTLPILDRMLASESESDQLKNTRPKVLDLGTGTGALALSIAKEYPQVDVQGVDVSTDAITLAEQNKTRLRADNCRFYVSDWFDAVRDVFEVIVSNPPYIDEHDPHLTQGDVRFEPLSALTANDEGLSDLDVIAATAPRFLTIGGTLLVEHGWKQGRSVRDIFMRHGFVDVETLQDLNGNDRVTLGVFRKKKG